MLLLLCALLAPHEDLELQIRKLDERLRADPENAGLHLRRAELHRFHEDWPAARADYRRARKLDPGLLATDLGLGRVELAAGRPDLALKHLEVYVRGLPGEAAGRLERARVFHALDQPERALKDYSEGMALLAEPLPDHYLERSRIARPLGVDRALESLEEGLRRFGNLVTLLDRALTLETEAGRFEAALARVDALLTTLSRKDRWLEIRGDLLLRMGRAGAAKEAYGAALAEIEALPISRRKAKETAALETRLREQLARP